MLPEYYTAFFCWVKKISLNVLFNRNYYTAITNFLSQTNSLSLCCQNSCSPGQLCPHSLPSQFLLSNLSPGCQRAADRLGGVTGLIVVHPLQAGAEKASKLHKITWKALITSFCDLPGFSSSGHGTCWGPGMFSKHSVTLGLWMNPPRSRDCQPSDPRVQPRSEAINKGNTRDMKYTNFGNFEWLCK